MIIPRKGYGQNHIINVLRQKPRVCMFPVKAAGKQATLRLTCTHFASHQGCSGSAEKTNCLFSSFTVP